MLRKGQVRQVNRQKISTWLDATGENGWAKLMAQGLGLRSIEEILRGSRRYPKRLTRKAFVDATGISEDELFPVVSEGSSAS